MTKPWIKVLLWLLTLGTAVMIFGFSAQNGEESLGLSHQLVEPLLKCFTALRPDLSATEQESLYWLLQQVVRKAGHMAEYAILGFWLRLLMQSYTLRHGAGLAWLVGTLYAATDEYHQMFSGERTASLLDVGIDSIGVMIGLLAAALLISRMKRRKKQC